MSARHRALCALAFVAAALSAPGTARANGIVGTEPRPINPEEPCAEAIGRVGDAHAFGTGSLIGDRRIVLTVAHAVVDAMGIVAAEAVFSLEDNRGRFRSFSARVVSVGTRASKTERARDWALLVMDDPPRDRAPLAVDFDKTPVDLFRPGPRYSMIGFSAFRRLLPGSGYNYPVISRNCGPTGENRLGGAGVLMENCSTMPGGSGSPMLEPGGCKLVAIDEGPLTGRAEEALPDAVMNDGMAVYASSFRTQYLRVLGYVRRGLPASEITRRLDPGQ